MRDGNFSARQRTKPTAKNAEAVMHRLDGSSLRPFADAFYRPLGHGIASPGSGATANIEEDGSLSYDPGEHGDHASFENDAVTFGRYRAQFRDRLESLIAFADVYGLAERDEIARGLSDLFQHRFVEHGFFSTRAAIVDGLGKRSLDEFCNLVARGDLPQHVVTTAIRELAYGVRACADGAAAHLLAASRNLALAAAGVAGELWRAKEELIRAIVDEELTSEFGLEPWFPGNHVHAANGVWDQVSDVLGLQKVNDGVRISQVDDPQFLERVLDRIADALTPGRIALRLAEDAHAIFAEALRDVRGAANDGAVDELDAGLGREPLTAEAHDAFEIAISRVRDRFGLALQVTSFVESDEAYASWVPVRNGTRAAVDILKSMDEQGLLTTRPEVLGHWADSQAGGFLTLFGYGQCLVWAIRSQRPEGLPTNESLRAGYVRELLTVDGLREWLAAREPADGAAASSTTAHSASIDDWREAVAGHLLDTGDADALRPLFPEYFRTSELAMRLLGKLGNDHARELLESVAPRLDDAFVGAERCRFVDALLARELAPDVLLESWYPDPVMLAIEPRGHYRFARVTAAVRAGDVRTFEAIVAQLDAREPNPLRRAAAMIGYDRAEGRVLQPAALQSMALNMRDGFTRAMHAGHEIVVRAWSARVIREAPLHGEPAVTLMALVGIAGNVAPPLHLAMFNGHAGSVEAFGSALVDPIVAEHLHFQIVQVLAACEPAFGVPALSGAMMKGHTQAVRAFMQLVGRLHQVGRLSSDQVAELVSYPDRLGQSPLVTAINADAGASIRTYGDAVLGLAAAGAVEREWVRRLLCAQGHPDALGWALRSGRRESVQALEAVIGSAARAGVFAGRVTEVFGRPPGEPALAHQALLSFRPEAVACLCELLDSTSLGLALGDRLQRDLAGPIATMHAPLASHALANRNAEYLRACKELFTHPSVSLTPDAARTILSPFTQGAPSSMAPAFAHPDVIEAYAELLDAMPGPIPTTHVIAESLQPERCLGFNVVVLALANGDARGLRALGVLLDVVLRRDGSPSERAAELLSDVLVALRDPENSLVAELTVTEGAEEVLRAWGELLDRFRPAQWGPMAGDVLQTVRVRSGEGLHGLYEHACAVGSADSVRLAGSILTDRLTLGTISGRQFAARLSLDATAVQGLRQPARLDHLAAHWDTIALAARFLDDAAFAVVTRPAYTALPAQFDPRAPEVRAILEIERGGLARAMQARATRGGPG